MPRIGEHPGTVSAPIWINQLQDYQSYYGRGSLPGRNDGEDRALRQWVERMRRMAASGLLPLSLVIELARCGINLERQAQKACAAGGQEDLAFRKNLERLKAWMAADSADRQRLGADITYQNSRTDKAARQCYTFLEHMRLKMRQNLLPSEHYFELITLPLLINGGSVAGWLDVSTSLRREALGEELRVADYPKLPKQRVTTELAAREGQWGSLYIAGTGTMNVCITDGEFATIEGYVVNMQDWHRLDMEFAHEPTLVSLPDLGCYGVLTFAQPVSALALLASKQRRVTPAKKNLSGLAARA